MEVRSKRGSQKRDKERSKVHSYADAAKKGTTQTTVKAASLHQGGMGKWSSHSAASARPLKAKPPKEYILLLRPLEGVSLLSDQTRQILTSKVDPTRDKLAV